MINIKGNKGITLFSLVITIIVLLILAGATIYNFSSSNEAAYYKKIESDIKLINDKLLVYYNNYTEIPKTNRKITIDGTVYYEIELSKLDNITLNYGREYGNTVALTTTSDVYVVDEVLNVYYLKSIDEYLKNNPVIKRIELSTQAINLKKNETEETTGKQILTGTIKANAFGLGEEPVITWEVLPENQTAIELSQTTGKEIIVTAVGTQDATVELIAKCTYEGEEYTAVCSVTLGIVESIAKKGDFVEYGVAYKDVYKTSYEYSTINGWRLIDYTYDAETNIYSNVKLMSTGVPLKTYNYFASETNKYWHVKDELLLRKFRNVLGGNLYYTFYTGDDNYNALQATAGTYYNLGSIKFIASNSFNGYNEGFFESISVHKDNKITTYDKNTNNTVQKTGNELFKVREDATIRLITLPEINRLLKRTTGADDAVDSLAQISITQDAIGLYRLNQLKNVPGMNSYNYDEVYYWLASPAPSTDGRDNICYVRADGTIGSYYYDYGNSSGARPVICISSNIRFSDSNNDGALEITVVQ